MMNKYNCFKLILSGFVFFSFNAVLGVDFSSVPGTVLDYQPLDYDSGYSAPRVFISDPEILVLSNGTYLAAHALAGRSSNSDDSGKTTVFRSTDKGSSWTELTTIHGILRGSLVEYGGAVYLLGSLNDDGGGVVICKSTDQGDTWSRSATFAISGLATPNNPVVFNGRLWSAGGRSSFSAPVESNFLAEASWTKRNGFPAPQDDWPSGIAFLGEGQLVASPDLGLYIMPKVKGYPYTTLAAVDASTGLVSFDPDTDFVSLPGAEKKFGAAYDAVSGKAYVLSNPILPIHENSGIALDMIRNTAALLSSSDLRNWNVERIVIYSTDEEQDGFGYMNFDVDGSNMVIAARTAFPVGSDDPERGHDSNLLTFHVIPNFRNAAPDHVLKLSGENVLRYEKTNYEDAPLGDFALGSTFAGAALTSPDGFGKASNGDVYIHESGGRILHFDASGNFLGTVDDSPVTFQASALSMDQPANGECSWTGSSGGNWFDSSNWYYWGRADSAGEIAVFGSALTGTTAFTVDESYTLAGFRFLTTRSCTFSGSGGLMIEGTNALFDIYRGSHEIELPVTLNQDALFSANPGTDLTIDGALDLNGSTLTAEGSGELKVENGNVALKGGSFIVGGGSVVFTNTLCRFGGGAVEFAVPAGFSPEEGDSFHLMEGDIPDDIADHIVLPALAAGLTWDTSALLSSGNVSVIVKVPEEWMSQYGLATSGVEDFIDSDGDGMDNYSEWKAGTDPLDAHSFFTCSASATAANGFGLHWAGQTGRTYRVDYSTNLTSVPAFTTLRSGIPGIDGLNEFADTNRTAYPSVYYRIVVE
ncbi:hypothetical protein [Tichowtungia aerotolerans]|uniref:Exo-alpha-sialidase n=1 Tax=Tichowtungia aerotolerans TaxID=2697043 RepID=A0A6P1MEB4_9BACT|nr:hypothetical protein [Tichowtungia aerotolerans]QHI69425.1 hypothetical protein GT409_08145 [Tichowtungia aerotolerans]